MLQEWIGREETADDEVALVGSRRMAALLNQQAGEIKRGGPKPANARHLGHQQPQGTREGKAPRG